MKGKALSSKTLGSKALSTLIILFLLMAIVAPAIAQSVSDVEKSLTVNGQPAPSVMNVAPGDVLNFRAIATFTYHGPGVTPEVRVDGDIYLSQGGAVIDHVSIDRNLGQMSLSDGQRVTIDSSSAGNDITYTVPANVRGSCALKLIATVHADVKVMGQVVASAPPQTESVIIILNVAPATPIPTGEPTVTPTPLPTPVPETLQTTEVNTSTAQTQDDGTLNLQADEIKARVTNETGNTVTAAASFNANFSSNSTGGELISYITDHVDNTAGTQFMLAAVESGSDIVDIAFVLVVEHPTLANGKHIRNAVITMKVSESWVNANGGVDAIKILRYSDGISEALDTRYVGRDSADSSLMVFEAISPNGLSQFALVALASLPVSQAETATGGASINYGVIIGGVVAALVVVLLIIGGIWMTMKKRKARK